MRVGLVLFRLFAGLVIAALGAACTSSTTTQSSSSATSEASAAATTVAMSGGGGTVIKIGVDLPLSGGDAANGIPTDNGVKMAIEEANKKAPNGFTFAVDDLDDAVAGSHDPAQGAQNVRNLIADSAVLAMVGPFNSSVAVAEIPLANDAGLAQIAPSTTNPGLTQGDAAKKLRPTHPDVNTFFRVCTDDDRQGTGDAQFTRSLGLKKVFIVDDNETYGKGLADVYERAFKAAGGTVLGHEHLNKGQQDFKALLTKAHSLGPDAIFYGGTTVTGGGLLRKQMSDAGMGSLPYIGGDGISDATFLSQAGATANGSYYTVAAPELSKLPTAKTFIADYQKRWNAQVGPYSANGYTAAKIEIAAIVKAIGAGGGKLPTRAGVLANVAATKNFASPIGSVGFDHNGDTTVPILSVYKIQGGKAVFVKTLNPK